jgi:hypothetical protein
MNRFLIFILFFLLLSCDKSEKKLVEYLTQNNKSMWDMPINEMQVIDNDTTYFERRISYLFDKNYICEVYKLGPKQRHAVRIGPKINVTQMCNKWEILNDSTIRMNCKDIFVIRVVNRDTLYLIDTLRQKKHEMYRISEPWNINKESVEIRDKLIENEEYLNPYIYY